jgi:hypothetical protein
MTLQNVLDLISARCVRVSMVLNIHQTDALKILSHVGWDESTAIDWYLKKSFVTENQLLLRDQITSAPEYLFQAASNAPKKAADASSIALTLSDSVSGTLHTCEICGDEDFASRGFLCSHNHFTCDVCFNISAAYPCTRYPGTIMKCPWSTGSKVCLCAFPIESISQRLDIPQVFEDADSNRFRIRVSKMTELATKSSSCDGNCGSQCTTCVQNIVVNKLSQLLGLYARDFVQKQSNMTVCINGICDKYLYLEQQTVKTQDGASNQHIRHVEMGYSVICTGV